MIPNLTLALTWLGGVFQQASYPIDSEAVSTPIEAVSTTTIPTQDIPKTTSHVVMFPTYTPSYTTHIPWGSSAPDFGISSQPAPFKSTYSLSLEHGSDQDNDVFAESHPKEWGSESAAIRLPGPASSIAINDNETLLAVGYQSNVIIYELPSLKHLQTTRELGIVSKVQFQPGLTNNRVMVHSWAQKDRRQYVTRLVDLDHELKKRFTDIDGFPPGLFSVAFAALKAVSAQLVKAVLKERFRLDVLKLRYGIEETLLKTVLEADLSKSPWFERTAGMGHGWCKVSFSPDGTFFIVRPDDVSPILHIIAGSQPFQERFRLTFESPYSTALLHTVSLDNRYIVSTSDDIRKGDGGDITSNLRLWNATDGSLIRLIGTFRGSSYVRPALSADADLVVTQCNRTEICIWRTDGGLVQTLPLNNEYAFPHPQPIVALAPSAEYVAVRNGLGGDLQVYDVRTSKLKLRWRQPSSGHQTSSIRQILFDKHGRLFWRPQLGPTFAYDMAKNLKYQFNVSKRQIGNLDIVLTKDGFIRADADGVVRIWVM